MKKIYLLSYLMLMTLSVFAQYRRTFIILQDNSGSYYNSSVSDIQHLQNKLIDLFGNEYVFDEYSLIYRELEQGVPFYDKSSDKIHFYWFVADQKDNVIFFNSDGSYDIFESYFLTKTIDYNNQESLKHFFDKIYSNRPTLKSANNGYGISTYSFTSFAYPLCMDILPSEYSKEYIVVLISDFKAGSTFGNKQDEKIFKDAFRNKARNVLNRVSHLNSQFVKIDLGDYYKDAGYNSIIGFYVFKIRPNAGAPNPENIEVRIDSDIHLEQNYFEGNSYKMTPTKIVFNHAENLSIDKVNVEFKLPNGKVVQQDITSKMGENKGTFMFDVIDGIILPSITNSSLGGNIDLKYIFDTSFCIDDSNQKFIKYTFETKRTIDYTNFTFQTKLSTMEISVIIATILLLLITIVIVVLWRKGKPTGILTKFSHFNDSYESYDYSTEGQGKIHTDYKCWSVNDQLRGSFEIKVYGRLNYKQHNRFYNWQEETGYMIRIYPSKLICPNGFEAYISSGGKISNNANMPIEITDAFKDSKFEFSVVFRDKGAVLTEPQPFAFEIELASVNNGIRSFTVSTRVSYQFHVGPNLGNVWLGLDPGTTGSCIAIATSSDDLTIEQNNDEDLISPSVILIPTDRLKSSSKDEIRKVVRFGHKAQAVKNESDTMRKFVSIKKLLGYNTTYSLGTSRNGVELNVDSAFLSTLMVEKLMEQHQLFIEANKEDYPQFFENDIYNPKRAVIAIPNNFTASKIEHLRECVLDVKDSSIKELRFIYEAEAILVNYINSGDAEEKKQESEQGETIFIFDMGGATINTTLANVKRRRRKNDLVWEIEIISKLGYGVGGDTIDYAYLQWIYSKSDEYNVLAQNNPFGAHSSMDMKGRRKLKDAVLELKKQTIRNYEFKSENLIDRYHIAQFNGYQLPMNDENDVFVNDIKNGNNSFLYNQWFEKYVYDNVRSIVSDVLFVCEKKNIEHLDTILMSGRSSHFPRIKETVESVVRLLSGYKPNVSLLALNESKSAVAKGACYYGVLNSRIVLQNMTVNGVFGVIQKTEPNKAPIFHKLIDDGDSFDEGFRTGKAYIQESQGFTFDGGVVRFCQVMGVNPTEIIARNEKHKYSEVAVIPAQPFPVQEVQIAISDKDKILCSVTNTNGETIPPVETIVKDSDIMACNDEQYTFFVKQL